MVQNETQIKSEIMIYVNMSAKTQENFMGGKIVIVGTLAHAHVKMVNT